MSIASDFEKDGYVVVATGLPEEVLDAARSATGPLQPEGYHWSVWPRVFEGWKTSEAVRKVVYAEPVMEVLREIGGGEPRPSQTINFSGPSNQRLHQDGIHFQTWPRLGRMLGAWTALEDTDERNGTLAYVPGTHRLGHLDWQVLGFEKQKVNEQYDAYRKYEDRMEGLALAYGGKRPFKAKKGETFVWGLEMLHGGWTPSEPTRTRHSMVTHYFMPGCGRPWAPMFSDARNGDFYWKSGKWFDREGVQRPL